MRLMKYRTFKGFGPRLAQIRKSRGITQEELGKKLAVSTRVVAYYEDESAQPPGALLIELARVLAVSTDELLGLKTAPKVDPNTARILRRVHQIEKLSVSDQRAVFKFIDALLKSRISFAPQVRKSSTASVPLRKVAGKR